ncbi:hypothetical protein FS837_004833, partial [Tulasnella sp. UAMH 9824]
AEETSFAAESSFTRAPLNTRIVGRQAGLSPAHAPKGKGKEKEVEPASLKGVPLEVQEALVLEDLLYVLMGIPGTYVTVHPSYDPEVSGDGVQFAPNPSLDPSLRDLVQRILPLATYYTAICAFIENRSALECGLVNHALCASIREMLNKDYLTLLAQLEHQFNTAPGFSLQKLWFYVHPTLHTLSLIWSLTDELTKADSLGEDNEDESDEEVDEIDAIDEELGLAIGKKGKLKALDVLDDAGIIKGGEVVAVLWERVTNMSGDPSAHELYLTLFRQASAPYADMLQRWITTGQLKDPHQEFMVRESKDITRQILDRDHTDDYWERRYVLRDGTTVKGSDRQVGVPRPRTEGGRLPGGACIPPLLDAWKKKILLAGKYLNVIRECGIDIQQPISQSDSSDESKAKKRKKDGKDAKDGKDGKDEKDGKAGKDGKDEKDEKDKESKAKEGTAADEELKSQMTPKEKEVIPLDDERFYQAIEDAYSFANRTLLRLLVKDQALVPRLRSLKYYFFLSHSAYIGGFFETARAEFIKQTKYASLSKLQSLYELALASSPGPMEESFRGDVKLKLDMRWSLWDYLADVLSVEGMNGDDAGLGAAGRDGNQTGDERKGKSKPSKDKDVMNMNVIDGLTLDYTVKFPLSLVISRKNINYYQCLFRFLLNLKYAEQVLTDMWSEHKCAPWSQTAPHAELDRWRLRVIMLRTKMLWFVQHVLAFVTGDVLEPRWRGLEKKLDKAAKDVEKGTVDQLLEDHLDFLNSCMSACMLTIPKFVKHYSHLLHTCIRYAAYTSKCTRSLEQGAIAIASGDTDLTTSPMDRRWEMFMKFEINFNHTLKAFIDLVHYNAMSDVTLLPLVHRLSGGRPTF